MNLEQPPVARKEEEKQLPKETTERSKEKINFDENKCTFLLNINKNSLDLSKIKELAEKSGFEEKAEFHITIIGFKNANEIKKIFKKSPEKVAQVKDLLEKTNWDFSPETSKYEISKDYKTPDPKNKGAELTEHREAYIQMISLPSIKEFYDNLNKILGTNLEYPPTHTTLYTKGNKIGIGINSESEFNQLNPKPIEA